MAAERSSKISAAEDRTPAGDCALVDLSGSTQVFPEKTEVTVVSVDRDGEIDSVGNVNGNGNFPAKEIRPAEDGGDSGQLGVILEAEKEDDLQSQDTSSSKGN